MAADTVSYTEARERLAALWDRVLAEREPIPQRDAGPTRWC